MAARLDLEARLRALRAPVTAASAAQAAPPPPHRPAPAALTPESLPVAPVAPAVAWPEPPIVWPEPPTGKQRRASSARVPEIVGDVMVAPRRHSSVRSSHRKSPPVQSVAAATSTATNTLPDQSAPMAAAAAVGVSVATLLGPAYTEAIQIGQFAIESERSRNVHTAIDAYIRAGQLLISIGRQQHTEHLQTIVKKKALALLERAEGLSDWVATVLAHTTDKSAAAVDAAFAVSQRAHEQALDAKEALVAHVKAENSAMTHKLNQLVVLSNVRMRFRRMLSARRARKAEEADAQRRLESTNNGDNDRSDGSDSENNAHDANRNDGECDDSEPHHSEHDDATSRLSSSVSSSRTSSSTSLLTAAQREVQKRDLVNELHARIGLPEISALRTFAPLSADATKDHRHVELEDELAAARLEAERLRAAVQEMEDCFEATLAQTRQQSLERSTDSAKDLAVMEHELQRVRTELARERRLTASSFRTSSNNSSRLAMKSDPEETDDDPDAFEDVAMIESLRSSLHAATASNNNNDNADDSDGDYRGGASSSSDVDDDGGVWL